MTLQVSKAHSVGRQLRTIHAQIRATGEVGRQGTTRLAAQMGVGGWMDIDQQGKNERQSRRVTSPPKTVRDVAGTWAAAAAAAAQTTTTTTTTFHTINDSLDSFAFGWTAPQEEEEIFSV